MTQYSYKLQSLPGWVAIIRSDGALIPEDLNNVDYQEYLEWTKQGNNPEPEVSTPDSQPVRSWAVLSAQLYQSSLYQQHLRMATKGASSDIADRLWWIDKDLTTILVNWVSDEETRIQHLEFRLRELIKVLAEGGFPITEGHRQEILDSLNNNGFPDVAALV